MSRTFMANIYSTAPVCAPPMDGYVGMSTQRPLPDCIGRGLYSYQFNPVLEPLLAVIIPTAMQVHFGLPKTLHTQFGQLHGTCSVHEPCSSVAGPLLP